MNIIKRIDEMIEEISLLKHTFYQMWSDGKLTQESLAGYSKEYFQLVKAVPFFMTPIIEKILIFYGFQFCRPVKHFSLSRLRSRVQNQTMKIPAGSPRFNYY